MRNRSFKPWDVIWSLHLCEKPCRTGYTVASDFHHRWAPPRRLALQHLCRRWRYRRRCRRKGFPLHWPPFDGFAAGWRAYRRGARPTGPITKMLKTVLWIRGSGSKSGSSFLAQCWGAKPLRIHAVHIQLDRAGETITKMLWVRFGLNAIRILIRSSFLAQC